MTLHAPTHRAGVAGHHWMRDILIVGVVALLTVGAVWALSSYRPFSAAATTSEAQSLIEFRAAERDTWAGTSTSEQQSVIDYRAGERTLP